MSATDTTNGSAIKRSHDEITSATPDVADAPAQKRQNVGETPSDVTITIPVSKADQIVGTSTNVMTEPSVRTLPAMDEEEMMAMLSAQESGLEQARAGPSMTANGNGRKQQKEKYKQRAKEKYEKSAERYKGKGVREWGSRNEEQGKPEGAAGGGDADKTPRLPKYKCALLLGFSGSGYNGMQIQNPSAASPDAPPTSTKTIEGILFQALVNAGAVAATNADDPKKVDLSRAARTDAGVSAAGNVVSLKMIIKPPGIETPEDLTKAINEHLPEDIRVWGWTRTLQGFNARTACDTRVYEYLLPSYTLLPPRPGTHLHAQTVANATKAGLTYEEHEFWKGYDHEAALEAAKGALTAEDSAADVTGEEMTPARRRTMAELAKKRGFRISKEEVERFRELMKAYLGTHNFHNYTLNKSFNDRSCNRYMIDINVDDPVEHNGMEWISVKIHGQSFMLHQIRKMISLAVLAARTRTPASLIPKTFGPEQIHVPKAPALGLLLEQPRFKTYNENAAHKSKQNKVEHNHPLDFESYKDEIFAFKLKHIYERLRRDEESAAHYHNWNTNLDNVQGPSLSYLNPQGEIPEEAMRRKKGTGPKGEKEKTLDGVESDDDGKTGKEED
ncbi:tRNA pseudouridine synthase 1 [Naganishia albida]|nr:tRNA pseudouridine synthase 1 [Naganishia albida]